MRVIGIDPGVHGAIAAYDGSVLVVEDVPIIEMKKGKKTSTVMDLTGTADLFNFMFAGADHALIERVGSMPGQGVASTFKFGKAAGALEMGVAMLQVPCTFISPTEWKMKLGLNNDGEKSRQRVLQIFPKHSHYFTRKLDHNRAEAALLAWYCWHIQTSGKVPRP